MDLVISRGSSASLRANTLLWDVASAVCHVAVSACRALHRDVGRELARSSVVPSRQEAPLFFHRGSLTRVLLGAITLALLLPTAVALAARAPGGVKAELKAWVRAVNSKDPIAIAKRVPDGETVVFRTQGSPTRTKERRLGRADLQKELESGNANALGLADHLLLPRIRDLRPDGAGRWRADDKRCPEVVWIFAKQGKRWRLVEVIRVALAC